LKLLDKSKASHLLLIGSLTAVVFFIGDAVIIGFLGLVEYKISLTPVEPPILITAVTIIPIIVMLVQQYISSWKGYLLWVSIGMAFLAFVLLPLYSLAGIFQLHTNWNYFYQFLYFLIGVLILRVVFLWIIGIEQRHSASSN